MGHEKEIALPIHALENGALLVIEILLCGTQCFGEQKIKIGTIFWCNVKRLGKCDVSFPTSGFILILAMSSCSPTAAVMQAVREEILEPH